jgi:hypothetical protein
MALTRDAIRLLIVLVIYLVPRRQFVRWPAKRRLLGDDLDAEAVIRWNDVIMIQGAPSPRSGRGLCRRGAGALMLKRVWHPLDFAMQRRQLLSLKRLVETS